MERNSTRAPEGATTLTTKEAWDAAFAAWEAAKVAFDFAEAAFSTSHSEAVTKAESDTATGKAITKLAKLTDQRAKEENDTRFAALLTPAPDLLAVLWKMRTLYGEGDFEGDTHSSAWDLKYPAAVIADIERLQSDFATTWLAAWTKDGGSVVIDDEGKAQIGWPAYDLSPNYRAPDAAWPQEVRDNAFLQGQAMHDATMKARYEALRMVPGGVAMLKAHMSAKGVRVAIRDMEQGK